MAETRKAGAHVPKSIIVGTDGSPTATVAVRRAADLAAALGAKLTVVCGYQKDTSVGGLWTGAPTVDNKMLAAVSVAADQVVSKATEIARESGLAEVTGRAVAGNPPDVLVDEASASSADLIVVGSRGIRSATRRVLGNVPNKVVHSASCDVLVVDTDR